MNVESCLALTRVVMVMTEWFARLPQLWTRDSECLSYGVSVICIVTQSALAAYFRQPLRAMEAASFTPDDPWLEPAKLDVGVGRQRQSESQGDDQAVISRLTTIAFSLCGGSERFKQRT